MADKKLNELSTTYIAKVGDYIAIHDSAETGSEKLKKITPYHFKFFQGEHNSQGISIVVHNGIAINLAPSTGGPKARITVADVLLSIKGGTPPFTYSIKKAGGNWVTNADPLQAYIEYGCSSLGVVTLSVRVTDNTNVYGECETYCLIDDSLGLCT